MDKRIYEDFIYRNNDIIYSITKNAEYIHASVNQKYDGKPYSVHLDSVANCALFYGYLVCENVNDIIPVVFGAYFHDSIEDARLTYNDLMAIANKYMNKQQAYIATEIVYALTNEKGRTRAARANDKYYEGIRETPFAPFIKMCDRYANMFYSVKSKSKMLNVYAKEWEHFLESITVKDNTDIRFSIPKELIEEIEVIVEELNF